MLLGDLSFIFKENDKSTKMNLYTDRIIISASICPSSGNIIKEDFLMMNSKTKTAIKVLLCITVGLVAVLIVLCAYEEKIIPDTANIVEAEEKRSEDSAGVLGSRVENIAVAKAPSYSQKELQNMIDEALPGVVCWGDSITYGYLSENGASYPDTLEAMIDSEFIEPIRHKTGFKELRAPKVLNYGVSAENTLAILGRIGSIPYVALADFTIPADTSEVPVIIGSYEGGSEDLRPLLDVEPHRVAASGKEVLYEYALNPVTVNGITGEIRRRYDYEADRSRYYFARSMAGETVTVSAGTEFVSASKGKYQKYINVVLMGANGGYSFDGGENLKNQFKAAANGCEKYLLIGMGKEETYTASAELDPVYAKACYNTFGNRFITIQKLLSGSDTTHIPQTLLNSDGLHYTALGYSEIGKRVFEQLDALDYFDGLKAISAKLP